MTVEELLAERERFTHDFISAMSTWIEEFNRVTDGMIESLKTSKELE